MNTNIYKRPPMLALLIKDFRLCKPAIIAGVIALIAPLAALVLGRALGDGFPIAAHPNDIREFRRDLAIMIMAGLALATLTLPAVASTALARERRDRSGEFLCSLPVPRWRLVASKSGLLAAWTLLLCGGGLGLAELIRPPQPPFWGLENAGLGDLLLYPGLMSSLIGIAWLLGSFMRSETIAAAISIGGNITLLVFLFSIRKRVFHTDLSLFNEQSFMLWLSGTFLAIGIASLIAGTIVSLRRTSP